MERTPKNKRKNFGLWSKKSDRVSDDVVISKEELNNLETLPVIDDVLRTPKIRNSSNNEDELNSSISELSQFRVGWNDGSENAISPIYVPPVRRKIRRCADELFNRVSESSVRKLSQNTNFENDCDILQCVSWAKNLEIKPINDSVDEQGKFPVEYSTNKKENVIRNSHIDILDDSADELMVLCSQAVEESIHCSNENTNEKRKCTFDHGQVKKQKISNGEFLMPNENKIGKILNFGRENGPKTTDDQYKKQVTNKSLNNNNEIFKSFSSESCTPQKKQSSLVESLDLFKSVLEDEDDFSSIDFNYLDNLQNMNMKKSTTVDKVNECNTKPVVQYTKEQIEKRRLEAKRKLLLKENRSM